MFVGEIVIIINNLGKVISMVCFCFFVFFFEYLVGSWRGVYFIWCIVFFCVVLYCFV